MRKHAVIFVHGLAKKPPPAKLEEIWRWGLSRPDPNRGLFLTRTPASTSTWKVCRHSSTITRTYSTAKSSETEFGSYYEAESAVVKPDNLDAVAGELQPPSPTTSASAGS